MQMNARNLAVCFAPSLFDVSSCGQAVPSGSQTRSQTSSESSRRARRRAVRLEDSVLRGDKDMEHQRAGHECLMTMIVNAKDLFTV